MAQEYICMQQEKDNKGLIALNSKIFENIAEYTIEDSDALSLPKKNKSVTCKVVKNHLVLNLYLNMKSGVNLNKECESLQFNISKNILQMTGIKDCTINIEIIGYSGE